MTQAPSTLRKAVPGILTLAGGAAVTAAGAGVGIDVGNQTEVWPVLMAGIASLVTAIGTGVGNVKQAELAPPLDKDGTQSARLTCSIALAQAHREGDNELVDLLAKTCKKKAAVTA